MRLKSIWTLRIVLGLLFVAVAVTASTALPGDAWLNLALLGLAEVCALAVVLLWGRL